ncbi:MAG TPA: hypothetical protein VFI49_00085 [Rudaea sp.]|nr:hypothetical protein [Rudaea sp.]
MIAQTGFSGGALATLFLILHVAAGCAAILAGAAALSVAKGERLHRKFGTAFLVAMLVMGAFATVLSVLRQPGTILGSIFAMYLVASAWATVKRPEGTLGRFEKFALLVAVGCAAGELILGLLASRSPNGRFLGYPFPLYFVLGSIVTLAAIGDWRMILRGGISGASRIARHLWRMCFALFFATGSFFIGQQKVMPAFMHGSLVLVVLGVAPLVLMIFWLWRVRRTTARRKGGVAAA